MKEFWEQRYNSPEYVYGKTPNRYFEKSLKKFKPGKILLPAEGEGRNAVFAAQLGWDVTAFDISSNAREKALDLAEQNKVNITYHTGSLEDLNFDDHSFDIIGLIFAHFPKSLRFRYHQKFISFLKHNGTVIFEAFSKEQRAINSANPEAGGPKDIEMLFSEDEIRAEFEGIKFIEFEKSKVELNEGDFHRGEGAVIRFTGVNVA